MLRSITRAPPALDWTWRAGPTSAILSPLMMMAWSVMTRPARTSIRCPALMRIGRLSGVCAEEKAEMSARMMAIARMRVVISISCLSFCSSSRSDGMNVAGPFKARRAAVLPLASRSDA